MGVSTKTTLIPFVQITNDISHRTPVRTYVCKVVNEQRAGTCAHPVIIRVSALIASDTSATRSTLAVRNCESSEFTVSSLPFHSFSALDHLRYAIEKARFGVTRPSIIRLPPNFSSLLARFPIICFSSDPRERRE